MPFAKERIVPARATRVSRDTLGPTIQDGRFDKEKLQERLAKLASGVAVIRVGAASESEVKSKKEAFDDAISATKAAVAEGTRALTRRSASQDRRVT